MTVSCGGHGIVITTDNNDGLGFQEATKLAETILKKSLLEGTP